ncbi:MFS general substrate transporter [Fragilariopsis cylindrus CCMP1102]|uniref:MFS general substrate transporter n=1 Tax=Fragilariopsis cylindrus CCMP1102 TaxID=635003 RepID=A0A1E7FT41_9STRA|nr:MFS general substrate transporter [Fragilariopsis cylindrus CCMP1102]|eukprot:OEU21342.1 MFS general substrate transporter [Fragilariopsis cylindrus CCMP1102]
MTTEETKNENRKILNTDKVLWITYINIILYALSYQLQRPVEPYLIKSLIEKEELEGSLSSSSSSSSSSINQTYGNLQSFFSFCQFFGSPLVGILLDRIGIRKTSIIVYIASALSYSILASASDLSLLFVSKIPTIFQAAFLVAQATAATSTGDDASLRAAALGRMTTAYTIGATIGPALGGYLAGKGDFYIGAKFAVAGSILSAILSSLFLPDNNNVQREEEPPTATSSFLDDTRRSAEIALRPTIWPLLMVKVMGVIPLVLTQTLKFEPQQLGLVMSCGMFAVAAFGAFAMSPLAKTLGSFGMMNTGLIARSILGLIMAGMVTVYASLLESTTTTNDIEFILMQVIVVSILHALSQHVLATGLTTQTTGNVDKDEQGSLLGLEHSLFSLARIGGPAIATALLGFGGMLPVEMACGSLDILMTISLSITLPRSSKRKNT